MATEVCRWPIINMIVPIDIQDVKNILLLYIISLSRRIVRTVHVYLYFNVSSHGVGCQQCSSNSSRYRVISFAKNSLVRNTIMHILPDMSLVINSVSYSHLY